MKAALRRLKLEDLVAKIDQIDEQAALTLSEHPNGHTRERQRLIMAIARQIRSHLLDQVRLGPRDYCLRPMASSTTNEARPSPAVTTSDAVP